MPDRNQTALWLNAIQMPLMVIDRSGDIIAFNRMATAESDVHASQVLGKRSISTGCRSLDADALHNRWTWRKRH